MKISILTLFPEMFTNIVTQSIIKRAQEKKKVTINIYNLRNWAADKHQTVDDSPYGGGAGMILKPDVIDRAIANIKSDKPVLDGKVFNLKNNLKKIKNLKCQTILLTPKGKRLTQNLAHNLTKYDHLILICGHYGGFDERIRLLVDAEISLGDFVLTGGEIPAMAIADAVTRLIPDVINAGSLENETHSRKGYKQFPQYTRPEKFVPVSKKFATTLNVPEQLLSGNHKLIEEWRKEK